MSGEKRSLGMMATCRWDVAGRKIDLGELGSFSFLETPSHNAQKALYHHQTISAGAVIGLDIIMKGSPSREEVI